MTKQVKAFFIFLVLIAIFSVFSFFDVFRGVRSALLYESPPPLPLGISEDYDQDGLSNQDESYWNTDPYNPDTDGDGFLDGEEVASGFDPRVASSHELGDQLADTVFGTVKSYDPGDFMNANLTDDASSLLLAGMAAGDLTRTSDANIYDDGLNAVAFSTIDNFYKSMPVLNPTLNIVDDSQKNQEEYLKHLADIINNDLFSFTEKIDLNQNPFTQNSFFSGRAEHFRTSLTSATELNVPKNWTDTHKKILDLLNSFYLNHNAIAKYDEDSIKAIIAFNDINNLNTRTINLIKEVQDKITANQLKPESAVFKIMDILY